MSVSSTHCPHPEVTRPHPWASSDRRLCRTAAAHQRTTRPLIRLCSSTQPPSLAEVRTPAHFIITHTITFIMLLSEVRVPEMCLCGELIMFYFKFSLSLR